MNGTITYKRRVEHTWEYTFPVEESPWPVLQRSFGNKFFKVTRLVVTARSTDDEKPGKLGVQVYGPVVTKRGYGAIVRDTLWGEYPDFVRTILNVIEASL